MQTSKKYSMSSLLDVRNIVTLIDIWLILPGNQHLALVHYARDSQCVQRLGQVEVKVSGVAVKCLLTLIELLHQISHRRAF